MGRIEVTGELVARGPATAFVLDEAQAATVGDGAKRFAVLATVNGYSWRTTVTRMRGEFLVGLNREVREGAGVPAGEAVTLTLALDTEPREVGVPAALARRPDARLALAQEGGPGAPRGHGESNAGPGPMLTSRRGRRRPPRRR